MQVISIMSRKDRPRTPRANRDMTPDDGMPPREFLARFRRDKRGNVAILFALMLPAILGFLGLGIDIGGWYADKRRLQNEADAGAIGGAFELAWGGTSYVYRATSAATANGYRATGGNSIAINNPPDDGGYTTDPGAVEVTVTSSAKTFLAGLVVPGLSFDISARAVARQGENESEACVLALDTSGVGIDVSGTGIFETDNCSVASNSTDDGALTVRGSGDLITDCYSVVGDVATTAGLHTDIGCSGKTGGFPVEDPYAGLEVPADTTCDEGAFTLEPSAPAATRDADFSDPWVICGDLTVKGDLTLGDGVYVVKGDISVASTGRLSGEDVTIILMDGGRIDNFNGAATINLSAPNDGTAGDYEGILFFQDPDTTAPCTGDECNTLDGNASSDFEGVLYFPDQQVTIKGSNESSTPSNCLQVVALRIGFTGTSNFYSDNSQCPSAGVTGITLPGDIELVE